MKTPRQAAYEQLCSLIAQLAGRSRRAQRAMLETELLRALERAYELEARLGELAVTARRQESELTYAAAQVASAKAEARQRIMTIRREVFAVLERAKAFERSCRELLGATDSAVCVPPPALVIRPPSEDASSDPDDEAITERCPAPSGCQEGSRP